MHKGTVKWFNNQKGYGFITDSQGTDFFVHYTGLNVDGFKKVDAGETVEFDVIDTEKGKQAINVTVVNSQTKEEDMMNCEALANSILKVLNGEDN